VRTYLLVLVLAACGPPTPTLDAPNGDAGPCGTADFFTGEIVDWDSTDSVFCGVGGAELQAPSGSSNATNPNGRFQLCLPDAEQTVVTVTPPAVASQCMPEVGAYQLPGLAIARHDVIAASPLISMRMIGMNRVMPFFSQFGLTLDPAKAIVFVHVQGTPSSISTGATHDPPVAFDGSAWGSGDTGVDVVFPNVTVGNPATTSVAFTDASGTGGGTFPVTANTFTYVTLVAN
jgi:hypothetical protein